MRDSAGLRERLKLEGVVVKVPHLTLWSAHERKREKKEDGEGERKITPDDMKERGEKRRIF